jgi:hypothetical protein
MSGSTVFSPRTRLALIAKKRLGGTLGVIVKKAIARPRYYQQLKVAREGFRQYGDRYKHNVLYVAGMPKSGTTWLDSMLATIPGYAEVMLPEAVDHELRYQETLSFQLPQDAFSRLKGTLTVLRLHASGSDNNIRVLEENKVPYVVLYRDLRDVAVSHHYYVAQTPWHPEFSKYQGKTVQEGVRVFARDLLEMHVDWIRSWRRQADSPLCEIVTYEQMREDSNEVLLRIFKHYEIPDAERLAPAAVEANTFEKLSGGGKDSFFRKGKVGDWVNHFPADLIPVYERAVEDALR